MALGNDWFVFLFIFAVESVIAFFVAVLVIEIQLNFVIKVCFLEHLAEFARANLCLKRFLFIFIEVMFFRLVKMVMRSFEFLTFNDFLFNQSAAGGKGRDARHSSRGGCNECCWHRCYRLLNRGCGLVIFLLFAAEAEEPEA